MLHDWFGCKVGELPKAEKEQIEKDNVNRVVRAMHEIIGEKQDHVRTRLEALQKEVEVLTEQHDHRHEFGK
jgi:hypothetical protein